jgi:hypothetical protein
MNKTIIEASIARASEVAAAVPFDPLPRVRTLDDALASAGADVAFFLSVEASAFRIGTTLIPRITGSIALQEIRFPWSIRYTVDGGTKFARTYDGVRESLTGRPWWELCQLAQRMDPNCRGQYDSAEIPLATSEDLVVEGKAITAGTRVGITTPLTGFRPFVAWLRQVTGQFGSEAMLPVIASVQTRTKPGVKPWGIPFFTVLEGGA